MRSSNLESFCFSYFCSFDRHIGIGNMLVGGSNVFITSLALQLWVSVAYWNRCMSFEQVKKPVINEGIKREHTYTLFYGEEHSIDMFVDALPKYMNPFIFVFYLKFFSLQTEGLMRDLFCGGLSCLSLTKAYLQIYNALAIFLSILSQFCT